MVKIFTHKKLFPILWVVLGLVGLVLLFFSYSTIVYKSSVSSAQTVNDQTQSAVKTEVFVPKYVSTPNAVKGIYMSECVVGTPNFRKKLVDLIDTTELNSVVIDIKDFSGTISFPTKDPVLEYASMKNCGAPDMRDFIASLHEKNIYVIGRITVFQDPFYTKAHPDQAVQSKSHGGPWKDHKGLSFVDVSSKPYWDVVVQLSKVARSMGFDELNYDYVRYPSDGDMSDAQYVNSNKAVALENFFSYLRQNVKPTGVVMSADLFGMTTVASDDMGIGQQLERAMPYFDYIAPMVYPSHFAAGFHGFADPNKHVYDVISYSMGEAVKRAEATSTPVDFISAQSIASTSPKLYVKPVYPANKLRPWLQDFSYGGVYGPAEVRAQIQATYDVGLNSWMLWSAANTYTATALYAQ